MSGTLSHDAMLTKVGIAKALVSLAAISAGIHDHDQALLWCVRQGFIRQGNARDEIILTQRGCSAVWLFWKAYKAGRIADRGGRVDTTEWSQTTEGEHITLDDPYLHESDPEPA